MRSRHRMAFARIRRRSIWPGSWTSLWPFRDRTIGLSERNGAFHQAAATASKGRYLRRERSGRATRFIDLL